jgi:hypothetical protein
LGNSTLSCVNPNPTTASMISAVFRAVHSLYTHLKGQSNGEK